MISELKWISAAYSMWNVEGGTVKTQTAAVIAFRKVTVAIVYVVWFCLKLQLFFMLKSGELRWPPHSGANVMFKCNSAHFQTVSPRDRYCCILLFTRTEIVGNRSSVVTFGKLQKWLSTRGQYTPSAVLVGWLDIFRNHLSVINIFKRFFTLT